MNIDFDKNNGLVPAIIQDSISGKVLMLAYMNNEAYELTVSKGLVTFYSRSKNRLWTKGEESGNYLKLESITVDCDGDTLLVKAVPAGPVCHKGTDTCWGEKNCEEGNEFINRLESIIDSRKNDDVSVSYTSRLFSQGVKKIAQKVGEEATELILEAMDKCDDLFLEEAADLVYHLLVLLNSKGYRLSDVSSVLRERHFVKD